MYAFENLGKKTFMFAPKVINKWVACCGITLLLLVQNTDYWAFILSKRQVTKIVKECQYFFSFQFCIKDLNND
jgi:hypothetical protein